MTLALGNTNNRARSWFITILNYVDTEISKIEDECEKAEQYIWGYELCPSTGTPHVHLYITYENTRTWSSMKKKFPRANLKVAKGNDKQNYIYISKQNNFKTNIKPPVPLKLITELYPWQRDVEQLCLAEPDDRHIYWFYESTGGRGKSALCKYLVSRYPHIICIGTGKSADIITLVEERYTVYLLDFPRTVEGFAPFTAIEQLKNGMITDGKLKKKARTLVFNSPQVIIFANFEPDYSCLSADRWIVTHL